MTYILYKHLTKCDTIHMIKYLCNIGINAKPDFYIEKNHGMEQLPTIFDIKTNTYFCGIKEVIQYYENRSGINNLLEKSIKFKKCFPFLKI